MKYHYRILTIMTQKQRQVMDITDLVNKNLAFDQKPVSKFAVHKDEPDLTSYKGLCSLFLTHTTAALTTADLDPGTDLDYLDAFEEMIPKLNYRHPHDPSHVPDHIVSSLMGPSLTLPIKGGLLMLGTWQRVVLVEFDGPRERELIISTLYDMEEPIAP